MRLDAASKNVSESEKSEMGRGTGDNDYLVLDPLEITVSNIKACHFSLLLIERELNSYDEGKVRCQIVKTTSDRLVWLFIYILISLHGPMWS